MTNIDRKSKRLVGIFLLGWVLFNFPLVSLFDKDIIILGFPILYIYIFFVWSGLVFLIGLITRTPPSTPPRSTEPTDSPD